MSDTPTPEPVKECCKCAAYREINAAQAQQIAKMKDLTESALKLFEYARLEIERCHKVKP